MAVGQLVRGSERDFVIHIVAATAAAEATLLATAAT
jgi:hypothetical protein